MGRFLFVLLLFVASCGSSRRKEINSDNIKKNVVAQQRSPNDTVVYRLDTVDTKQAMPVLGEINLGKIRSGEIIKGSFRLVNNTNNAIVLVQMMANCGCLQADCPVNPILHQDTVSVNFTYNSKGKDGDQRSDLTIKSNNGTYRLRFVVHIKK